ncbi:MAG TPA: L-fucose/L-arabinose isomerase family protein [Spirochaetia bacterium]|nr:L-fucose/L-arabinose isomerase family protein [Spirochaetia bacterium]
MELQTIYKMRPLPKIGLLFLGRKRPGFDPEWAAEVRAATRNLFGKAGFDAVIPTDSAADDAAVRDALSACRAAGAEVLVVMQPTISDGRLAPVIGQLWDRGLVLWATTERPVGPMISANSLVGTHVFAATLRQLGKSFELVYGHPEDGECPRELEIAVRVAGAAQTVRNGKTGLVGYHAPGFVDLHSDPAVLSHLLGVQLHHLGITEFVERVNGVDEAAVTEDVAQFKRLKLPYGVGVTQDVLPMQSRIYLAVTSLMREEQLASLAVRCWPELPNLLGQWPYLAFTRLASEGEAVSMEGDVDGALGNLMAELLGLGPVYMSDWLEHDRSTVAIWHTGAMPLQMCDPVGSPTGPVISVQFNNKRPAVVDGTIRSGMEVTLYRFWRCDNRYHMVILEGRTGTPRIHLLGTNGLFETDEVDVHEWFDEMVHEGMPHHVHVIRGRHRSTLRKLARYLGITVH